MSGLKNKIVEWLRTQVKKSECSGVVFGMSGGVDSSVVAVLSKMAFGDNCLGLIIPCHSDVKDMEYAMLVAKEFNIRTELVHLNSVFNTVLSVLETKLEVTDRKSTVIANIKPRLRMITLYAFASKYNYLVCGTGNKSELLTGYFTKYGDGGVDILPLGGLLKTQVIELAKELKIPDVIISRPPTAGLWQGQTDESELGLTYAELDRIITAIEKNEFSGFDMRLVDRVRNMIMKSEHKRKTIPIFVIDS